MDKYYKNIKNLIESNLVTVKKNEINSNYNTLITYFNVGKLLYEAQGGNIRAKYGNEIIKKYSAKLSDEYGKGYDESNLKRMRQLYLSFQKSGALPHQLNWTIISILLPIKMNQKETTTLTVQ